METFPLDYKAKIMFYLIGGQKWKTTSRLFGDNLVSTDDKKPILSKNE